MSTTFCAAPSSLSFFFFNDTATTEIYTLSLHDALPISAYADNKVVGADEDHPLAKLADPNVTDMGPNFANYGGLKALCEQAAQAAFPDRCAVVRPGYIVGPGDPSDRFTYWPVPISRGAEVFPPGSPDDP